VDFLDAMAQTAMGVGGLAALNHYASGESWPQALLFASIFMFCFWLGRFVADRFSPGRRGSKV
jgi:fucose permease